MSKKKRKKNDDFGTIVEGETFCIDKLNHDYYTFYFPKHRSHIFLDEREMRDITETFTKYVMDKKVSV